MPSVQGAPWRLRPADDQANFSADRRHHHIFDPHTGYSPVELSGVTVAAPTGALADALAAGRPPRAWHSASLEQPGCDAL